MSGHSHFSTIKRKKEAEDAKRSKIFSKMARLISIAAKEGGDPEANNKLKQAIEVAKSVNTPKDNIERAIKKGTGELEGESLEQVSYECLGPEGVSLIIEGITDNTNRTLSEVRQSLQKYNFKLAGEGSIKWAFDQNGIITVKIEHDDRVDNEESLELTAIDSGALDIQTREYESEKYMEIITKPEELEQVRQNIANQGINIEATSLDWVAKEKIEIDQSLRDTCEKLFMDLDENDAIQSVYSNLK
jgi:YebC/PmpR family DNA-binding regulatory protein